jgi:nicotinamidase-related amidase
MINWQVSVDSGMLRRMKSVGIDVSYVVERCQSTVVPNIDRLIRLCRRTGVQVVFTRVGCSRADFSDAMPHFREQFREADARDGQWACEVIEALRPEPGELSLIKTGSSAFVTSSLGTHLRNAGIEHVIYTGAVTNGCVLLTLASGFDLGYYGYMISDATATFSERVQTGTEEMVSAFMAPVLTTAEISEQIARSALEHAAGELDLSAG